MRAGKLDRTITIKRLGAWLDDGYGNLAPGPSVVLATCRAQVIQASTEEFMRSWGASTETAVVFRTRHVDGVSPADTVTADGDTFDIIEVKPLGRRRGLELRCKRTGP